MLSLSRVRQVLARHLTAFTEWLLLVIKSINPSEGAESPKVTYAVSARPSRAFARSLAAASPSRFASRTALTQPAEPQPALR
eukprot:1347396-Pleurochrysis_carterae.AAC.1